MLRITVDQHDTLCRLKLAGRLCGPWVLETEYAWRSSSGQGKQIEVDMRELTGIDDYGRELLLTMHQAGARLVAEGVWMTALIEEITSSKRTTKWRKLAADQRCGNRRNSK
jgi:hypothetical protein